MLKNNVAADIICVAGGFSKMMGGQADWFAVIVCPVSCLGVYIGVTQIMETGFQKKNPKINPKKRLVCTECGGKKKTSEWMESGQFPRDCWLKTKTGPKKHMATIKWGFTSTCSPWPVNLPSLFSGKPL
jgi:hypothetical protein